MNTMRRLVLIDSVTAMGIVVATTMALWPGRAATVTTVAYHAPSTASPAARINNDSANVATVISANILSGSRRAPSVHYLSPDAELMRASTPPTASMIAAVDSPVADISGYDATPALYGIVSTGGTWRALLRLSPGDAHPSLFIEGDRRGAYRVVTIAQDRVTLAGPTGPRTLRLTRTTVGDSTGKRP